jgi:molybdenum cofactor cytidylyltransferase
VSITAILLAAGESTRMGRLKQLLTWDGAPLIAWQAKELQDAGADKVIVVLGHASEEIRPAVPGFATVVVNEDYRQGRATSLRKGAGELDPATDAVIILSVDQPRPAWISRRLIERWRLEPALVVSPRFFAGFGHPILIDGSLIAELRAVNDETKGLRAVIDRHVDRAASISIANDAINVDLNTPPDYEAALASYKRGEWEEGVKSSSNREV